MECFDVCLTMPISKITSGLNAKDVFYYTHFFKHVLLTKDVFLLSYLVFINSHENLRGRGRLEGTLDLQSSEDALNHKFLNSVNRFP